MSSKPAPRPAPDPGALIAGRYTLTRYLGSGGMGAVYEARTADGPPVAIKLILARSSAGGRVETVRFWREALAGAAIDDPNVTRVLDSGVDEETGLPYLVMDLLVGASLADVVERSGPLHPTLAARVLRQACLGVAAAHRSDVVHRDVKAGNLFLDQDAEGRITVRVLDFGIAKFFTGDVEVTSTGASLGTPLFMSPEQIADAKRVDARADVWSLGVTLYQALSGRFPFDEDASWGELALAISSRDARPLQDAAPWVDPGLATIVHGALLRDPASRCPSATELAAALAPFAGGSDELHAGMLGPLADDLRTAVAERAAPPTRWTPCAPTGPLPTLAAAERDPVVGKTLGARFKVLRAIGSGGMGAVYEAADPGGLRVAVKVIRADVAGTSATARRRFVREARVIQSITHEHVVRVLESDTDPDLELPYIAMELLEGQDLERLVHRQGPLPPETAARVFVQACSGLAAAHARGFVHRDVKPANILLARASASRTSVKVCDFGIAKALEEDAASGAGDTTKTAHLIGSPMYMSPEQAVSARDLDERTDVWSLGAALYEALTGVQPWQGRESVGQLVLAICSEPLVPVRTRAPWVPSGLAAIVHKAMQRERAQRYPSALAMAEALRAFTGGSSELSPAELRPLRSAERAASEEPLSSQAPEPPVRSGDTILTGEQPASAAPPPPERSRRGFFAIAGALAAGAVAVSILTRAPARAPASASTDGTSVPAATSDARAIVTVAASAPASAPPIEVARPDLSATATSLASIAPKGPPTPARSSAPTASAAPGPSGPGRPAPATTWR